jgi:hypothetical protein
VLLVSAVLLLTERGRGAGKARPVAYGSGASAPHWTDPQFHSGLAVKCWNVPAIMRGRLYAPALPKRFVLRSLPQPAPLKLSWALSSDAQTFHLFIANEDGSALDTNRASKIGVFSVTGA